MDTDETLHQIEKENVEAALGLAGKKYANELVYGKLTIKIEVEYSDDMPQLKSVSSSFEMAESSMASMEKYLRDNKII